MTGERSLTAMKMEQYASGGREERLVAREFAFCEGKRDDIF